MTEKQEKQCKRIIHSAAAAAAAGNAAPVPGVGMAADMGAMVMMTMSLASVFGGSLTKAAAKAVVIAEIKRTVLKHPVKMITKELGKLVPGLGVAFAAAVSATFVEMAGWALAHEFERSMPYDVASFTTCGEDPLPLSCNVAGRGAGDRKRKSRA